jgi:hypothetical protein
MTSLTPLPAARLTSETLLGVLQKPYFRWRKSRRLLHTKILRGDAN